MDSRVIGALIFAVMAAAALGFPIYDRWLFRGLPPKERTSDGGAMTWEPVVSYFFGSLLVCFGLAALHSGVWLQRDPVALVVAIMCFILAWFTFFAHRRVRVRWDAAGIEQQGTCYNPGTGSWNKPGLIRITWDEVREIGPDPFWPEVISGTRGEISLSFCRGRAALVSDAQERRPDLFQQAKS